MKNDVIIIGGGAAGLAAAVAIKKNKPSLSVRVLEGLPRVGKKLAATGNGRCNITNKNISLKRYHGEDVGFAKYALDKYSGKATEAFFLSIGVSLAYEGEKAYPASFQAASVVDCLRFAAEETGVIVCTDTKVTNIQVSGGLFKVIADNLSFLCKNLIIAAGLNSGGEKLGCDCSIFNLLKKSGFKTTALRPAIVQLKTETELVRQLKGIKVDANVSLILKGEVIKSDFGEVLFCDYGLSGPAVLQVSGAYDGKDDTFISLDIMPETDFNTLYGILLERKNRLSGRMLDEFFTGFLNKRLGQVILKSIGLKLNSGVSSLDNKAIKNITSALKGFKLKVTGTTGFSSSQVTSGGLKTKQFNNKTMESLEYKGLYAIGEILDIDGDCGGFNLQWAWSSALCAAESITGE